MNRPQQPSLLFIMMDQLRADVLGCYGNPLCETPNMDALARRGTVFERDYVTAVSCTPSKGTMLTGLYPHQHGAPRNNMPLSPEARTLPEHLADAAYHTGFMGLWHLGDELYPQRGFDVRVGTEDQYNRHFSPGRDPGRTSEYHDFLVARGYEPDTTYDGRPGFSRRFATQVPEEHSKPAFLADSARQFLAAAGDEPFVLYTSFLEPHSPYHSVLDDHYDRDQIPIPPTFDHLFDDHYPLWYRLRQRDLAERIEQGGGIREITARYLGLVSLVDRHVGRILAALEENGQADSTIVVITSDHGEMMGAHRMLAKGVVFEEAIHVPLIISVPWLQGPRRVAQPVSHINLVPTLLELLAGGDPDALPGSSLAPLLAEGGAVPRDPIIIEWELDASPGSFTGYFAPGEEGAWQERRRDAARTIISRDGWKLSLSRHGEGLLHHLAEDPLEEQNLLYDRRYRAKAHLLLAELQAWQQRTGDRVSLSLPPPR